MAARALNRLVLPVARLTSYPQAETTNRRRGVFRVSPGRAIDDLRQELERAGALRATLELDVRDGDIKNDGQLRANSRPFSPRVVVSFEHPTAGWLRYPCDTFSDHLDNIRAIALALEALRAVERYGVVRRAEQYAGWKALPASTAPTLTTEAAAAVLAEYGYPGAPAGTIFAPSTHISLRQQLRNAILASRDEYDAARRIARKRAHPDVAASQGVVSAHDPRAAWDQVEAACAVLDALHGIRR
jgi:hypothetical protein